MFWRLWEGGPLYWLVKGLQIAVPLALIVGSDAARRNGLLPELDQGTRKTALIFSIAALGFAVGTLRRSIIFNTSYANFEGMFILCYAITLGLALYYALGLESLGWFR